MDVCVDPWYLLSNDSASTSPDHRSHGPEYSASQQQSAVRTDDEIIVPTVWGFIMALGLVGNLLVAYVMVRYSDRSATNYFVVNLALTDLAFTIVVIPLTMIHYVLPSWILGSACCKFHMYTIYVRMLYYVLC